jgi:hypothetical protein
MLNGMDDDGELEDLFDAFEAKYDQNYKFCDTPDDAIACPRCNGEGELKITGKTNKNGNAGEEYYKCTVNSCKDWIG